MADFDDVLVRVQRKGLRGADAQIYTVELWLQGGRRLNERTEVSFADYSEPTSADPQSVATSGLDLFNRLFSGSLAVAFQQAWAAAGARGRTMRLRLALDPGAPALHAIPWELMYFDDSGGLSPARPLAADPRMAFSRYIESATYDEGRPVAERPIRMLGVIASPVDLARWGLATLDKTADERDFQTRFSAVVASGQFQCDFLPAATEEALHAALARGAPPGADEQAEPPRARGYDALLYYGHALYHDEGGSRLVLEDPATGRVALYDGDELIAQFQKLPPDRRPSLVVMVACNSAVAGPINSLAARLVIEGGASSVLAMQRLVEVTLARAFTFHLSEHLLRDGTIDVAVNVARRRVFQPDSLSWSTPVLYMRNAEGRLFSPNAQLEYVDAVLRDPAFVRWGGPEFIDVGVLAVAAGQDWNLLRFRPEDAPAVVGAIEAIDRALGLGLRPERRNEEHAGRRRTNLAALIGPPQSGQTTVLQRLTFDLANAVTRDVERPLGVYVSLGGYEQQRGQGRLERHIVEQARAAAPALVEPLSELFRPQATRLSAAGPRFLFILDNLDAVPERSRLDMARDLAALSARLPGERFLITSAQDTYPGQILEAAQVFVIQALGEPQILAYLRQRDEQSAQAIFRQIRENRLLKLAGDPSLLGLVYQRLAADPQARLTRNQLVQDYLDRMLGNVNRRYSLGDAARESLVELAWHSRWTFREQLPLSEVFRILGRVRRERDYSLEELYELLREARLLAGVGQHAARFVNPLLQAYCAAVSVTGQPDLPARLADIVAMCASSERLPWWEDVIYALAGLLPDPTPLFELLAAAVRAGSSTHPLLAARCLEAVPPEQDARLPAQLRAELIDACVLRLRNAREPSAERRGDIVQALGRLSYHQVRHELRRILVEKVRETPSGPRYEYTNVRIAAGRALRNIILAATPDLSAPAPGSSSALERRAAGPLVLSSYGDEASLADKAATAPARMPAAQELRDDQMLVRVMRSWRKGPAGRDEFRDLLRNSPSPPERALAAFALGDLADTPGNKLLDARQLLRVILSPTDRADAVISEEWQDTMWAAADALTLFDPDLVAPLLTVLVSRKEPIPDSAAQQLAYLAGRVRATNREVVDWLIALLVTNPSQTVKGKALQSLAWMGMGIPDVRLQLADGRDGPSLKELIQDIAASRQVRGLSLGAFEVRLRQSDTDGSAVYLRRKAIEALAWIGDADTIKDLGSQYMAWPIELREHWYLTAATIEGRLRSARSLR